VQFAKPKELALARFVLRYQLLVKYCWNQSFLSIEEQSVP